MFTSTIASRKNTLLSISIFIVLTSVIAYSQTPAPTNPDPLKALQWRSIGPYRGGRSAAVSGVSSQPFVFYYGSTGGGVWKLSLIHISEPTRLLSISYAV